MKFLFSLRPDILQSRSRKIDLQKHRETYPTTGMDGRGELNLAKHQQRKERKELGEELQLETSKLLEDEAASTTEEEARELAKKETETEMLERRLTDSWTEWQNGGKGNRQKDLDKNGSYLCPTLIHLNIYNEHIHEILYIFKYLYR